MIDVGVIGASGYVGMELLRLLLAHPDVRVRLASSAAEQGRLVGDALPMFRGQTDLRFAAHDDPEFGEMDLALIAAPDAVAMRAAPALLERDVRVIDLSADFRLRDPAVWEQWYGSEHAHPEYLREAVYGLPELYRDSIRGARLIANPGCYPTAICLGLLPLLERPDWIDESDIVADAKSGVSGAGRKASLEHHFCEVEGSFRAYKASGHRHLPEILQTLREVAGTRANLVFVPHLLPVSRGIEATLYVRLSQPGQDLQSLYERRYEPEPFVEVCPQGTHPDIRSARGSNLCRIAVHHAPGTDRVIILSVIDNLLKGAAGQAVQNMNIAFGFTESSGLDPVPA